jgi:RHS repeat-associated protein
MNVYQPRTAPSYAYDVTDVSLQGTGAPILGYDSSANYIPPITLEISLRHMAKYRQFTGKERDSESGLDYFGARYYGSALGRFTGPDAHGFTRPTILNPQKWNKYSYVLNNPFKYVNPDGLEELKIVITTSIPYKTTWMFGTYSGGKKTNTEIRVETSRSKNNGSPVLGIKEVVEPTKLLQGDVVANQAKAAENYKITGAGQTADSQFFGFHQEATNPLSPVPDWLTPAITADLDFEFDDAATWISVGGQITQFPSFDISVTRANGVTVPVYHRDPYFNSTLLLFLPNYVNTGRAPMSEPKGCVAIGSEKPTCEK